MAKANGKGFDLAKLDVVAASNKPIEIEIKDIEGAPTGVFFSIVGRDSDIVRNRIRAYAEQDMSGEPQDPDTGERRAVDSLVAATVGWRDGESATLEWGDERLEFNPENARRVYGQLIFIREQVSTAIFDRARFMKG